MSPIDHLRPGERLTYFTGSNLARARVDGPPVELADAVWQLALAGQVSLVQAKLDSGGYAYVAIRRHRLDKNPPRPATVTQCFRRKAA